MKIIWSPLAVKNLENIFEWLKSKNERAAINIYNDLFDSVEKLKQFPEMAALEPILSDSSFTYRSLVVRNFKIVYNINDKVIHIYAIWDCRQNPKKMEKIK